MIFLEALIAMRILCGIGLHKMNLSLAIKVNTLNLSAVHHVLPGGVLQLLSEIKRVIKAKTRDLLSVL